MLRVSKKVEYGVIALLHLASQPELTASVREIASTCNIPEPLLSKIMQSMKNTGFVSAVYGNHGGYRLNRDLSTITLLDVNQLFAGPVQVAECLNGSTDCPAKISCSIIAPMDVLNQKIIRLFQSTSLQSLSEKKVAAL